MNELVKITDKEIAKCIKLQKGFAKKKDCPHFAPKDGICCRCGRNIYQNYEIRFFKETRNSKGYANIAGKELITGCPHCSRTFCD